jgi:hypothetical protein
MDYLTWVLLAGGALVTVGLYRWWLYEPEPVRPEPRYFCATHLFRDLDTEPESPGPLKVCLTQAVEQQHNETLKAAYEEWRAKPDEYFPHIDQTDHEDVARAIEGLHKNPVIRK